MRALMNLGLLGMRAWIFAAALPLTAADDPYGLTAAAAGGGERTLYRAYAERELAWFRSTVIDPYFANPGRTTTDDALLREVLTQAGLIRCEFFYDLKMGTTQTIERVRPLANAGDAKVGDPLFPYLAWRLSASTKWDRREVFGWNIRCRERWRQDEKRWNAAYPASLLLEVDNAYLAGWSNSDDPRAKNIGTFYGEALAAGMERAWAAGEFTKRERAFTQFCRQAATHPIGAVIYVPRVLALVKDRDDWFAHMVRGQMALVQAWAARGQGWANTVKPEGWASFKDGLKAARQELEAAWKLNPGNADIPAELARIAFMESDKPAAITWFKRAIAIEFDNPVAYDAMLTFLAPRWFGTAEERATFGAACQETQRYDTAVPALLLSCLANTSSDQKDDFTALFGTKPWKDRLEAVALGYEKALGKQAVLPARARTDQACFLLRVGDRAAAIAILRAIPAEVRAWHRFAAWGVNRDEVESALVAPDKPDF